MSLSPPNSDPPAAAPAALVAEHDSLPLGTRFGEFEILRVVGVGGFGIVYLAQDHSLERQVALKEYMPAALAARGGDGSHITVRSAAFAETYAVGLRSFINEARLLARFDHPSLVKVYRFWEGNGTAYMVMPFLRGMTLRDARRGMARAPDEGWIRSVIDPLLGALDVLHREGVYHRDIAPDNILLPPDGPPILLDFGAARHVISDRTQTLTAILKPSYAPIEQYAEMSTMRQGPWTDIYALGAVMHFLLFGAPPPPATARAVQPDAEPIEQRSVPGASARFVSIVAWMLGVRPADRPQSVAVLREALNGVGPLTNPPPPALPAAVSGVASGVAPDAVPVPVPTAPPPAPAAARPDATTMPAAARLSGPPPTTHADEATAFPATQLSMPPARFAPAADDATRAPQTVSAPVAAPTPEPTAPAERTVPPAKPLAPAPSKKGLMLAGLGAAFVVAAVVLWQFVGLLGGRARVDAPVNAASAAASGARAGTPVPASAPAVAATSTETAPASPPSSAAAALSMSSDKGSAPASDPPHPANARPVPALPAQTSPSVVQPVAPNAARVGANAAPGATAPAAAAPATPAAASSPRGRVGRPVPPRDVGEPVASPAANAAAPVDDESRNRAAPPPAPRASGFVANAPRTATEFCGKRVFIALAICMERECERPLFRDQADCRKVIETKRQRDSASGR